MRYISTKAMRRLGVMAVGLLLLMVLLGTGMGYIVDEVDARHLCKHAAEIIGGHVDVP